MRCRVLVLGMFLAVVVGCVQNEDDDDSTASSSSSSGAVVEDAGQGDLDSGTEEADAAVDSPDAAVELDAGQDPPDAAALCPTCESMGVQCGSYAAPEGSGCGTLVCPECTGMGESCVNGLCINSPCGGKPRNQCGGCGVLPGLVGDSCGLCGAWRCQDTELVCGDDHPYNVCGGCDTLPNQPGQACGRCGGTWSCVGDSLACVGGTDLNTCGECYVLAAEPGTSCPCGGTVTCGSSRERGHDVYCEHAHRTVSQSIPLADTDDGAAVQAITGNLDTLGASTLGDEVWYRVYVTDTWYSNLRAQLTFSSATGSRREVCAYYERAVSPELLTPYTHCDDDVPAPDFSILELPDGTRFGGCCKQLAPAEDSVTFGVSWSYSIGGDDSGWFYFKVRRLGTTSSSAAEQCLPWELDYNF